MLQDERRRQFYSRALGWVILLLLSAMVVLGLVAARGSAPENPECRLTSGALPQALQPLRLELAREPRQVRELLRGPAQALYPAEPAYVEALCIEARVARHRAVLGLDSALFIPLYVLLGLAALGWYFALALRARGADWGGRGRLPRALLVWSVLSAVCLALTATLDAEENRRAHAVLSVAMAGGEQTMGEWVAAVSEAREGAVAKWLAAAAWATTLAALAGLRRRSLSLPRGSERRRRWASRVAWLLLAIALCAAAALGAGAGLAWLAPSEATDPWVFRGLGAGFLLIFVHAVVLFVLHRMHLPRRLVQVQPSTDGVAFRDETTKVLMHPSGISSPGRTRRPTRRRQPPPAAHRARRTAR